MGARRSALHVLRPWQRRWESTTSVASAVPPPWPSVCPTGQPHAIDDGTLRAFSSRRRRGPRGNAQGPVPDVLDRNLLPQICIVGRPNVGKSALYNRLVRRKEALVFDTPGSHVTRDYREGVGQLGDLLFRVIDTSGLEPYLPTSTLQGRAAELTGRMMQRSDVTLFMLDASEGILPADKEIANWMRANMRAKVVVTANKCERKTFTGDAENLLVLTEAAQLGLGKPVAISASHGEGMVELYEAIQLQVDHAVEAVSHLPGEAELSAMDGDIGDLKAYPMKLAIVGLPNVGKSTLSNKLIGEERSLTGPEPGLTRDAVRAQLEWNGWKIDLVDTAGWMRETRLDRYDDVGGAVAKMASLERQRSIRLAHVVALVVDAKEAADAGMEVKRRELAMAAQVVEEGRGLVLVLNKIDLIPADQRQAAMEQIRNNLQSTLQQVPGLACLGISATTEEGLARLLPRVEEVYEEWNRRIGTGELNRWFSKVKARQVGTGGSLSITKVKYISQVKRRPPSFSAFVTGTKVLSQNSAKFIVNSLREDYGMYTVPIRLVFRTNTVDRVRQKTAAR